MDEVTLGIFIFAALMSLTGLLMVIALVQNQLAESPKPLNQVLLPFILAEGIFMVIFASWFLTQ